MSKYREIGVNTSPDFVKNSANCHFLQCAETRRNLEEQQSYRMETSSPVGLFAEVKTTKTDLINIYTVEPV
jgi:hypothetical protein